MKAAAFALAVLAGSGAVTAEAEPRPIHPYRVQTGQRVRLWTQPEHGGFASTNATVTAVDNTGLTLVIDERTELVPFTDITKMDVRRGWKNLRRGAAIGLVIGAVAGVLVEDGGDAEDKLRAGAIYGAVGAAVGTATAAAIWPAKWIPVDLDEIRDAPAPGRGAMRLSFTLTF